jgi:hypothetical protein
MSTGAMMGLLEPKLRGFGFTKEEVEDLSYALSEILADLEHIMPVLLSGRVPSRDDVLELISHVVYHWPGHQKEVAKIEKKMPMTASAMLSKARRKELGLHAIPRKYALRQPKVRRGSKTKSRRSSGLRTDARGRPAPGRSGRAPIVT